MVNCNRKDDFGYSELKDLRILYFPLQVKEPQPSTSEQQTEPPPAGSDIPLMRLFGKIEAIYGIAKLPNESVLNALLTTEKIKSSGCFLALVLNQIQLTLKEERIDLQTASIFMSSTSQI